MNQIIREAFEMCRPFVRDGEPSIERIAELPKGSQHRWLATLERRREEDYRRENSLMSIEEEQRYLAEMDKAGRQDAAWRILRGNEREPDYAIHAPWNRE